MFNFVLNTTDSSLSPTRLSTDTKTKLSTFQASPNRSKVSTFSSSQHHETESILSKHLANKHQTELTAANEAKTYCESASQDSGIGSPPAKSAVEQTLRSTASLDSIKDVFSYTRTKSTPSSSRSDKPSGKSRSRSTKPGKSDYTPLEQQFMEIKEQYADAILFVECGYRYRFFGEDAEVSSVSYFFQL